MRRAVLTWLARAALVEAIPPAAGVLRETDHLVGREALPTHAAGARGPRGGEVAPRGALGARDRDRVVVDPEARELAAVLREHLVRPQAPLGLPAPVVRVGLLREE